MEKAASKVFLARAFASGASFIGIIYFSKILSPDVLGTFFLFVAVSEIITRVSNFGLNGAVEKRISEGYDVSRVFTNAIFVNGLLTASVLILVYYFQSYISKYVTNFMLLAFSVVILNAGFLVLKTISGEGRVGDTAIPRLFRQLGWVAFSAGLVYIGFSEANPLIVGYVIGNLIFLISLSLASTIGIAKLDREIISSIFNYSKFNFISFTLAGYLYNWADVLVIGWFLTESLVSYYEVSWRVTVIVILFSEAIGDSLFPLVSKEFSEGNFSHIKSRIENGLVASLYFIIPGFLGVLILRNEILSVLFQPDYTVASGVLVVLMAEKIFRGIHIMAGHSLQAVGKVKQAAFAALIAAATNILLNIILVPIFGIIGAAFATLISFGLNTSLHFYYLRRTIPVALPRKKLLWCTLCSISTIFIVYLSKVLVGVNSIVDLVFVAAGSLIVYVLLSLWHDGVRSSMVPYFEDIVRG